MKNTLNFIKRSFNKDKAVLKSSNSFNKYFSIYNPNVDKSELKGDRLSRYSEMEIEKLKIRIQKNNRVTKLSPTKSIFQEIIDQNTKKDDEPVTMQYDANYIRPFKDIEARDIIKGRIKEHYNLNKVFADSRPTYNLEKLRKTASDYHKKETEGQDVLYREVLETTLNKNLQEKLESKNETVEEAMNNIIKKLGYLDYREFLTINKYILDEKIHNNYMDVAKRNILGLAMEIVEDNKREFLTSKMNELNMKRVPGETKSDVFLKNINGASDLFSKYYESLKEREMNAQHQIVSIKSKVKEIQQIIEKKSEARNYDDYNSIMTKVFRDPILDNEEFGFNKQESEIDTLIRRYRSSRLKPIEQNTEKIVNLVSAVFNPKKLAKAEDEKSMQSIEEAEERRLLEYVDTKDTFSIKNKLKDQLLDDGDDDKPQSIHSHKKKILRKPKKNLKEIKKNIDILGLTIHDDKERKEKIRKMLFEKEEDTDKNKKWPTQKSLKRGSHSSLRRSKLKTDKKGKFKSFDKELNEAVRNSYRFWTKKNKIVLDYDEFMEEAKDEKKGYDFKDAERFAEQCNRKETLIYDFDLNDMRYRHQKEDIILFIKYLIIVEKLKLEVKYEITNLDVEKSIYSYLRKKLESKEFNFENEEQFKNDPFLSNLLKQTVNPGTAFYKDFQSIKRNYIASKTEFEKSKLLNKFDDLYSRQFGYDFATEEYNKIFVENSIYENGKPLKMKINEKVYPINVKVTSYDDFTRYRDLIQDIVENYYKEYRIKFMYNAMDYYTNKQKVRQRIQESISHNSTLEEINQLTSRLAYKISSKKRDMYTMLENNLYDINEDRDKFTNIFKLFESKTLGKTVESTKPPMLPKVLEDEFHINRDIMGFAQKSKVIKDAQLIDESGYLSKSDLFEIDFYRYTKRDPFFRNYMNNFLAFQADQKNNFAELMNLNQKIKNRDHESYLMNTEVSSQAKSIFKYMNNFSNEDMQRYYNLAEKLRNDNEVEDDNDFQLREHAELEETEDVNIDKILENKDLVFRASGRRKTCFVLSTMKPGTGIININGIPVNRYFRDPYYRSLLFRPLELTGTLAKVDFELNVRGGGIHGQAEAIIPAISRCLVKLHNSFEEELRENLCLTIDTRQVERKKPGLQKARKGQVYRRR